MLESLSEEAESTRKMLPKGWNNTNMQPKPKASPTSGATRAAAAGPSEPQSLKGVGPQPSFLVEEKLLGLDKATWDKSADRGRGRGGNGPDGEPPYPDGGVPTMAWTREPVASM